MMDVSCVSLGMCGIIGDWLGELIGVSCVVGLGYGMSRLDGSMV